MQSFHNQNCNRTGTDHLSTGVASISRYSYFDAGSDRRCMMNTTRSRLIKNRNEVLH